MSQAVILKFTPSQQDYARVFRLFFFQRTSTRLYLGFLAIAFGFICYEVISNRTTPSIFEIIWLLLPPLFVAYIFFIQPNRMASQAMRSEQLSAETTWQIGDDGVEISNSFGSTLHTWDSLDKLVSTREYYLLLLKANKNTFRFLPLRSFSSAQEKEQFLDLVKQHLPVA